MTASQIGSSVFSLQSSVFRLLATLLLLVQSIPASSQDENFGHWAFAPFFGTGWYSVSDDADVFILRVAPRWQFREPSLDAEGKRNTGIQFRFPVTVGVYSIDLENVPGIIDPDNFGTVQFTPGVEFEVPINKRWSIKPLFYLGWGAELNGDQTAVNYAAGIKSRYAFKSGDLDWALVNSLGSIGYSANPGGSEDVVPFLTGLEFRRPLGNKTIAGERVFLDWHLAYTAYFDDLEFIFGNFSEVKVADEWEIGIAFSKQKSPLEVWRFSWDRLGLAYRVSGSGDVKGIMLVFRSLFDR